MRPSAPSRRWIVLVVAGLIAASASAGRAMGGEDRILVFVRSTAPYHLARADLLRIAPDGVHIPQLSADAVQAQRQAEELRAAGVRYLFQYKDLFTREPMGLQRLYGQWAEWLKEGILTHPRPVVGPEDWAQRDESGGVRRTYSDTRLMMCPSNPVWRGFARDTIVGLARDHGDGVMCDNPMCQCYCGHCQRRFDAWMRERYTPAQLREVFGLDPGMRPLPMFLPEADEETARVLLGACRRFWVDLMADFFALVKAAGEEVHGKGRFLVAPNSAGHKWFYTQTARGVELVGWGDAVTTSYVEPGVVPGFTSASHYCGLTDARYVRNTFDYLYGASRPSGAQSLLLKAYTGAVANPAVASLALAEGLALGGAFVIYPTHEPSPKAPNMTVDWAVPMAQFIRANRERLLRTTPVADTAVLYSPHDMMCGFPEHLEQCLQVGYILQRLHVPQRLIHLARLDAALRDGHPRTLILPGLRCLGEEALAILRRYAEAGGAMLVVGEVGTHTGEGRRRTAVPALLKPPQEENLTVQGRVAWLREPVVESLPAPIALVYGALHGLVGATPSLVPPDRFPGLLVSLADSDDGRTRWVHLLDYGASLDERGPRVAMPRLNGIPLVAPLPDRVCATSVTLRGFGDADSDLSFESGREGVRFQVPSMSVYALVEIRAAAGSRPATALSPPANPALVGAAAGRSCRLTAQGHVRRLAPTAAGALDAPMADLPPGLRYASPWYVRVEQAGPLVVDTWAFGKDGGKPVKLRLVDMDGTPLAEATGGRGPADARRWGDRAEARLMAPHAGVFLLLADAGGNHYRIRPRCAQAAVECHPARPLHTADNRPLGPLYFLVPQGCEAFTVSAVAEQKGETCRIVVRDPAGREALNQAGEMDQRQIFRIQAPPSARGRAWSFTIGPGDTGFQEDVCVTLEGVPPLVAESPSRLLVPVE